MKFEAKVSVLKVDVFSAKYRRKLMRAVRDDIQIATESGQGPDGAFAPYVTPDLVGIPVDLTKTGLMLSTIKTSARKKAGSLKPGVFYGRFIDQGTKKMQQRPWLILRKRTLKRIQKWTKRRLQKAFASGSLRRVV